MITQKEGTEGWETNRWMFWLALSIALLLGMATAAIAGNPLDQQNGLLEEIRNATSALAL